jgi:hypothetical protein
MCSFRRRMQFSFRWEKSKLLVGEDRLKNSVTIVLKIVKRQGILYVMLSEKLSAALLPTWN